MPTEAVVGTLHCAQNFASPRLMGSRSEVLFSDTTATVLDRSFKSAMRMESPATE